MRFGLTAVLVAMLATTAGAAGLDDNDPAGAVEMRSAGNSLTGQLNELSARGDYAGMLTLIAATPGAETAVLLNYKGYALRKTGQPEAAIAEYRKALTLNPDLLEARSYLGQGLLDMGDVEGAKAQLLEIRNRGGRGGLAYVKLKNALLQKTGY